jgi:hypothetical protein
VYIPIVEYAQMNLECLPWLRLEKNRAVEKSVAKRINERQLKKQEKECENKVIN